ncbi:5545_t:CDS:1, partial [Dentiscutata heterogama]
MNLFNTLISCFLIFQALFTTVIIAYFLKIQNKYLRKSINEKNDLNRNYRKEKIQDDDILNKISSKFFGENSATKIKEYIAFS